MQMVDIQFTIIGSSFYFALPGTHHEQENKRFPHPSVLNYITVFKLSLYVIVPKFSYMLALPGE